VNPPAKGSKEIGALSALLNRIAGGLEGDAATFRNPNGVYMKLMNSCREPRRSWETWTCCVPTAIAWCMRGDHG
jgi:DUF1680 family protein